MMRTTVLGVAVAVLVAAATAIAIEPVPIGPAFEVNPETSFYDPEAGAYFAGWCCSPAIAGNEEGGVFVTWTGDPSQEGLYGRIFDEAGATVSPRLPLNRFVIDEDDFYVYYTSRGSVGADGGGNFVVAWSDASEIDGLYGYHVRMRRVGPTGNFITEKVVDVYENEDAAGIAVADNAAFVIAWYDTSDYSVRAQRGTGNNLKGSPVSVGSSDTGIQGPYVAIDGLDQWIVAWESRYDHEIRARVVDKNLDSLTSELTLVDADPEEIRIGGVAPLDAGGFVVAWWEYDSYGSYARSIDAVGTLGPQFPVGSAGAQEVALSRVDENHFVVAWYEEGPGPEYPIEVKVQLHQNDGTPEGSPFVVDSGAEGGHYGYLAITDRGDGLFALVWDGEDPPASVTCEDEDRCGIMARYFALSEDDSQMLLPGRRLLITNKVPDLPDKNRGKWLVKDEGIAGVLRGGVNDPRCLFDAAGTVKASIRFVSSTSGQDTGSIPLPCENWQSFGPSPQRNWKYRDKTLAGGPCDQVVLKHEKSLKVSCKGKAGVTTFPYDLQPGQSEGSIDVALTIGNQSYCTTFPPLGPLDGQDGKRFLGSKSPAPATCAALP